MLIIFPNENLFTFPIWPYFKAIIKSNKYEISGRRVSIAENAG